MTNKRESICLLSPFTQGEEHYVYRRNGQPCLVCGTTVKKMEGFAGRNLFWCPVCQTEKA
jgi:endonuclease-8